MAVTCVKCGKRSYKAYCFNCKPRQAIKTNKRPPKEGKMAKSYRSMRNKFFLENDPPYYCHYCLYEGTEFGLDQRHAKLEHTMSKARHPEFRTDMSKIVVTCDPHNAMKGSRDYDEFLQILDEFRRYPPSPRFSRLY